MKSEAEVSPAQGKTDFYLLMCDELGFSRFGRNARKWHVVVLGIRCHVP